MWIFLWKTRRSFRCPYAVKSMVFRNVFKVVHRIHRIHSEGPEGLEPGKNRFSFSFPCVIMRADERGEGHGRIISDRPAAGGSYIGLQPVYRPVPFGSKRGICKSIPSAFTAGFRRYGAVGFPYGGRAGQLSSAHLIAS